MGILSSSAECLLCLSRGERENRAILRAALVACICAALRVFALLLIVRGLYLCTLIKWLGGGDSVGRN